MIKNMAKMASLCTAGLACLWSVSAAAQTSGISASKNAQSNVVLDFTFNERKTGGMWLTAYENNVYSYTIITGATETALANGYWRYVYTTTLHCDTGDQFRFRVQGNYSRVDWLPGPTDTTYLNYACTGSASSTTTSTATSAATSSAAATSSSKPATTSSTATSSLKTSSSVATSTATSASTSSVATSWPAASTRVENGVLISNYAERFRVRHELSANDFNNFNIEYWVARFGSVELRDYTRTDAANLRQANCGTTEPCMVFTLQGAVPVAMSDSGGNNKDCNQQVPNLRFFKIYGDETNFEYGYVMDIVLPDGSVVAGCSATQAQRTAATKWRAVMRGWPNISRPFTQGSQIEFETTISFDRAQITGDNVNYYGQTMRYVLGQGFVVNNRDSMVGPLNVNDSFAQLGGAITVPQLSASGGAQQRFSYSQHAYNIGANHIADWLMGRRILHSDMSSGNYIEEFMPGPQAVNGNLPMPELAGMATNAIQPSCTQCHSLNASGAMQARQNVVPPKIIGLGLIEAIPAATIQGWAAQNGGRVSNVTVNGQQLVGRYGWRAETATIRQQIAKALHDDMGVGTSFTGFGPQELSDQRLDQLVTYIKLVAVPTPRKNLTQQPGHQLFSDMGCAGCHKMTTTTGVDPSFPELSNQTIHPYTDVLLHDLSEGYFRTAPLWGLGLSGYVRSGNATSYSLMHDGLATSIEAAIGRHNGEGATARANFNAASATNRQALVDYLQSL